MDLSLLENDLTIAGFVLLLELCVLLPFIGWYVVRMIVRNLPTILSQISEDPKNIEAIKKLVSKFGLPTGGKMTVNNAIGMAMNALIPRLIGGLFQGPAQPPPPELPPPG